MSFLCAVGPGFPAVQPDLLCMTIYVKRLFSAVISFFWRATVWLQRGFPVPEERYKAWTPPQRHTAVMFCEGEKTGSLRGPVVSRMMSLFSLQQSFMSVFPELCCFCCFFFALGELRAAAGNTTERQLGWLRVS